MNIRKLDIKLTPSAKRMLLRPFSASSSTQQEHILFRILSTPEAERREALEHIKERFSSHAKNLEQTLLHHFELVKDKMPSNRAVDHELKLLIGASFTQQYSLESTALFNPSIVIHPQQSHDNADELHFIMSLRAIGEGHVSSIIFREGVVDAGGNVRLQPASPFVSEPRRTNTTVYEKYSFVKKLEELGARNRTTDGLFEDMTDHFTYEELDRAIGHYKKVHLATNRIEVEETTNLIRLLATSNFEVSFGDDTDLSERVLFPMSPSQSNGLEDARFVRFTHDDGNHQYFATFTAYDGKKIMPELVETQDFKDFKISTLNGPAARNKGMALFPRKINGLWYMLGRQDNESLYLMRSDNPYFWYDSVKLINPTYTWEYVQIGNCGSPIEIDEGWLVITHGVGPVRSYCLGVILLDKNDPSKVIGRLKEPLLAPTEEESYGYVPNVLYTCGALVHKRRLILPYAMSDVVTSFATVELDELLGKLWEGMQG